MILRPVVSRGTGGGVQSLFLGWGAGSVGTTVTPRYLYPWYSDRLAEVGELGFIATRSGELSNFSVYQNIPEGNGNTIIYRIRVAGVTTSLVVSLASTAFYKRNTTDVVSVTDGDLVSVLISKSSGVGKSPRNVVAAADFV
jgi:hypothetical protein